MRTDPARPGYSLITAGRPRRRRKTPILRRFTAVAVLVVAAVGVVTPAAQADTGPSPLTYGQCIAEGVVEPGDRYIGPEATVDGQVHHPQAEEPPGTHWEYHASC